MVLGHYFICHIVCAVRQLVVAGHLAIFYVYFGGCLAGCCACASPGGDLVHTTKVSHYVCALFLACPLPWMGHLVVG